MSEEVITETVVSFYPFYYLVFSKERKGVGLSLRTISGRPPVPPRFQLFLKTCLFVLFKG